MKFYKNRIKINKIKLKVKTYLYFFANTLITKDLKSYL